jgi:hypothetical protein
MNFKTLHNPYLKRYTEQYQKAGLFGNEKAWMTREDFLSDNLILAALAGSVAIGYFNGTVTRALGIDIDDHRKLGEAYLLNLYSQVRQRIGVEPSLLVKSPRGLHAYWYLDQLLPSELLVTISRENLRGIPVEVKPSVSEALRIPRSGFILDPIKLVKMKGSADDCMGNAPRYNYADLFNAQLATYCTVTQKRDLAVSLRKAETIAAIETQVAPHGFMNGSTNQQFLELEQAYRCAGLSIKGALDRFKLILDTSPYYSGPLTIKEILSKLQCTYKKNAREFIRKPHEVSLFNEAIIETLVEKSPFAKQRNKPIRRFLTALLSWCDWQDDIYEDKPQLAMWDWYYRFYRKNRKEGYYPLPYASLKKWNSQYNELVDWLIAIDFLETSPYQPSKNLGICKYYRVKRDGIIGEKSSQKPDNC